MLTRYLSKTILPPLARHWRLLLVVFACLPWLLLLAWMAQAAWFLTDDAFISFRYVRNLLEGNGLVFNPGERVEGYTNFLWVLELAALWGAFGLRPEHAAPWLSVVFTLGTIAAMVWWVVRLPALRQRGLVAWMALGLVCSSATFAVWTSGGGLETRQFTFFVVLAVACLGRDRERRALLAVASLSLAAASLTRPEGPLLAACCFAWYGVQRRLDTGRWFGWEWAYLAVPCVTLVATHYVFRYGYYGEWVPNTYYAKFVRPWYEIGWRYLAAAALETGLYLLLPLAAAALVRGWHRCRCLAHALPLLCVGAHMVYVARVGGDHFEYRPLDFYWPLLAIPAAAGIVHSALALAPTFKRLLRRLPPAGHSMLSLSAVGSAVALFCLVLLYANGLQAALLVEGAKVDRRIHMLRITLDAENAGWLLAAPGLPTLNAAAEGLRSRIIPHAVGMRFAEHREFAAGKLQLWQPYEQMERGLIPADAVAAMSTIGVAAFYLPDLTIVDRFGLTDATVAHHPVATPNHWRTMAHDRSPPDGYLEERGVNVTVYPASHLEWPGAWGGGYTIEAGPGVWLSFNAPDRQWVADSFDPMRLRSYVDPSVANRNVLIFRNERYVGDRLLLWFANGDANWRTEGDAFDLGQNRHSAPRWIDGSIGEHYLTSLRAQKTGADVGRALSPEFTAAADELLSIRIGGGSSEGVGLRLLADGEQVAIWRGLGNDSFGRVDFPLAEFAGRRLQLELFDNDSSYILLSQALILRPAVRMPKRDARLKPYPLN